MAIEFKSSLNEIDVAFGDIMLKMMQKADTRTLTEGSKTPLWTADNIVMVDELDTEEIFNAWLIKNKGGLIDIKYPIMAYTFDDIEEVFYGTGNRMGQWEFETSNKDKDWAVGDDIVITKGTYRGESGVVKNFKIADRLAEIVFGNGTTAEVPFDCIRMIGEKAPKVFKAKQFITSYSTTILVEFKSEARMLQNNFILRCADGEIWHEFESKILDGEKLHVFTVFDIPNISKVPKSNEKLSDGGYIYALSFKTKLWGYMTDEPLPISYIEEMRMNVHVDNEPRTNRIVIN